MSYAARVERRDVFDSERRVRTHTAARRYAALASSLLALNFLLLRSLTWVGLALLPAKVLTELALVSTSFAAQRAFVFRPGPGPRRGLTGDAQGQPTAPTGATSTIDTTSR